MILGECGVFAAMFLAGVVAGILCCLLDILGKVSKAAGVICDVLTAITMGFLYFIALYHAASGVFRLYSLAAYLLGLYVLLRLRRRFSPTFRRAARRVLLPLFRAYDRVAKRMEERLRPFRERREEKRRKKRAIRLEKRTKRLAVLAEKRRRNKASSPYGKRRRRRDARIVLER